MIRSNDAFTNLRTADENLSDRQGTAPVERCRNTSYAFTGSTARPFLVPGTFDEEGHNGAKFTTRPIPAGSESINFSRGPEDRLPKIDKNAPPGLMRSSNAGSKRPGDWEDESEAKKHRWL